MRTLQLLLLLSVAAKADLYNIYDCGQEGSAQYALCSALVPPAGPPGGPAFIPAVLAAGFPLYDPQTGQGFIYHLMAVSPDGLWRAVAIADIDGDGLMATLHDGNWTVYPEFADQFIYALAINDSGVMIGSGPRSDGCDAFVSTIPEPCGLQLFIDQGAQIGTYLRTLPLGLNEDGQILLRTFRDTVQGNLLLSPPGVAIPEPSAMLLFASALMLLAPFLCTGPRSYLLWRAARRYGPAKSGGTARVVPPVRAWPRPARS